MDMQFRCEGSNLAARQSPARFMGLTKGQRPMALCVHAETDWQSLCEIEHAADGKRLSGCLRECLD
ncbi:hypothetical protein ACTXT7_002418 [Hymenolepis weldensis]